MPEEPSKEIADLNQWLAERNLIGGWSSQTRERDECKPYLWKWSEVNECVQAAAELIPMEMVSRRILTLINPSFDNSPGLYATIGTITVSIQYLAPGEIAAAHRHTSSAIRFILEGAEGAVTVVEGERAPISTGDLLTTPGMTWHDHYSNASTPAIWLDALDNRLVRKVGKSFGDPYPTTQQPVERPDGFSAAVLKGAKPPYVTAELPNPPFRYAWEDTLATLNYFKESEIDPDPYDGIHLVYAHPVTGGPTMTTFSCEMQLLTGRQRTLPHRHNSSTIYQAFRGSGTTVIDDRRFEWTQGDIFVVPPWSWHHHENVSSDDAMLFSLCDRPAMATMGLYREEQAGK